MNETLSILGIPFNNNTLEETVHQIIRMTEQYASDRRPRQVATANVDFLVNALGWRSSKPRHPELLNVLRRADLVTADGMPLVWLSALLATPLKARVTGADLVPALARRCAHEGLSVYFLGGRDNVAREAAEELRRLFPGLLVAGTDAPFVHTAGTDIADSEIKDKPVIDKINRAAPDILLIGFGNPKQEIWFNRNRHNLNVPVTIGVGGTFEFIIGTVKRAPSWMQHRGLEWIWRISQDPQRLIKRYMLGLIKFSIMALPQLIYLPMLDRLTTNHAPPIIVDNTLVLPARFDRDNINDAKDMFGDANALDLSRCRYIDPAAAGLLLDLSRSGRLRIVNNRPERLLSILRCADLPPAVPSPGDMLNIEQHRHGEHLEMTISGILDADHIRNIDRTLIYKNLPDADCTVDLSNLDSIDGSGIEVLLKLHRHQRTRNKRLLLINPSPSVLQMFTVARVIKSFTITDSPEQARRILYND